MVIIRNFELHPGQSGLPGRPESADQTGGLWSEPRPGVVQLASCRVVGSITVYLDEETGEVVIDGLTDDGDPTHLIAEVPGGLDEESFRETQ